VQETLGRYYSLLPGNARAAYALTGPSLQAQISQNSYVGFWDTWSDVELLDVRNVSDQGDRITATTDVQYTDDAGGTEVETHAVTFVRGGDGQLLVDLDVPAG
jgi:hypothetical protein